MLGDLLRGPLLRCHCAPGGPEICISARPSGARAGSLLISSHSLSGAKSPPAPHFHRHTHRSGQCRGTWSGLGGSEEQTQQGAQRPARSGRGGQLSSVHPCSAGRPVLSPQPPSHGERQGGWQPRQPPGGGRGCSPALPAPRGLHPSRAALVVGMGSSRG